MSILFSMIIILCLILIAYQDIRTLQFSIYPLLLVTFLFLVKGFWFPTPDYLMHTGINLAIIISILLITLMIFKYKRKPITKMIGAGDVLLWISICTLFSPLNFLLMFNIGIISSLAIGLILLKNRQINKVKVPVAGIFAILCVIAIILETLLDSTNLLNQDDWILTHLNRIP